MLRAVKEEHTIFAALFSCRFGRRIKGLYVWKLTTRLGPIKM